MARHLFDTRERATRSLVAQQIRALADEIDEGTLDLADEEWAPPMVVEEPVEVEVDLLQRRHEVQLTLCLRWPLDAG